MRRCLSWILLLTLMAGGCSKARLSSSGSPDPAAPAKPPASSPHPESVGPSACKTEAPGGVVASGEPIRARASAEQLSTLFAAVQSPLTGVFVRCGSRLEYLDQGGHRPVVSGPRPRALAVSEGRALVTDGVGLFWFDWTSGTVESIVDVPAATSAARRGDTYLLQSGQQVLLWTPGQPPVTLAAPEVNYHIYGLSLSPDGRYAAVAYDLDPPRGLRTGVAWVYELSTGRVAHWSAGDPKGTHGLWLLGWSGPHTLRFVVGARGSDIGYTWELSGAPPAAADGSHYSALEAPWPDAGGAWVALRPEIKAAAVQVVAPGAAPVYLFKSNAGLDDVRFLLNGHPAFRTRSPAAWWEVMPDGTLQQRSNADDLF